MLTPARNPIRLAYSLVIPLESCSRRSQHLICKHRSRRPARCYPVRLLATGQYRAKLTLPIVRPWPFRNLHFAHRLAVYAAAHRYLYSDLSPFARLAVPNFYQFCHRLLCKHIGPHSKGNSTHIKWHSVQHRSHQCTLFSRARFAIHCVNVCEWTGPT